MGFSVTSCENTEKALGSKQEELVRHLQNAVDYFGRSREFYCEQQTNPHPRMHLEDTTLQVRTYYINYPRESFPGRDIEKQPPDWQPQSVSAHANASDVAKFFQTVLEGASTGQYVSSILCVEDNGNNSECSGGYWLPKHQQALFGQEIVNGQLCCCAVAQDIVAHEFTHALTSWTVEFNPLTKKATGLDYINQSGALDESYADIFAILIANQNESDIGQWNWNIGSGFGHNGAAVRNLQHPGNCAEPQPEHMDNYLNAPENNDHGGVHHNSGIHNKAAYNLLTSQDNQGNYLFDVTSAAQLFYLALTRLSKRSDFIGSRRAIQQSAKTLFGQESPELKEQIRDAIALSFDRVGVRVLLFDNVPMKFWTMLLNLDCLAGILFLRRHLM